MLFNDAPVYGKVTDFQEWFQLEKLNMDEYCYGLEVNERSAFQNSHIIPGI